MANPNPKPDRIRPAIKIALITAAGVILAAILPKLLDSFLNKPPASPTPRPVTSQYSFEEGVMGWIVQTYSDSQACVQVVVSDERAHDGRFSLAMRMDLSGDDPDNHKRKGEAWVDLRASRPRRGDAAPLDLAGRTVTAWVYAPQGALGEEKHPNGVQLFVKDERFRSLYGAWKNVAEGVWDLISLPVGDAPPEGGYMDSGFDPHHIIAMGVKMGAGGESHARYQGLLYVDEVDW